jgi:HSP20 family molecular chaperone IbpA
VWEDDASQLEGFEDNFDRIFTQAVVTMMESSLFDLESMSLRPLYRMEVNDKDVMITFDLPRVAQRKDVTLNVTEDALRIEARTRNPVKLKLKGPRQSHAEFEKYMIRILLPVKVESEMASAKLVSGILTVRLPIRHKGKTVKIG